MIGIKDLYAKAKRMRNSKDPWFWQGRFVRRILVPLLFRKNNGTYILEEEWDHLVILDACRYDTFEEIYIKKRIGGELEYRISRASNTKAFLSENFGSERFEDIIYISANPHVSRSLKGKFYKVVSAWKKGWNENLGTVPPSVIYESALEEIQKHPDKKLIIHFIQPHHPYISLNIDSLISSPSITQEFLEKGFENSGVFNPFNYISRGFGPYIKFGRKALLQAHKENLRWVMPYVNKLVRALSGKIVVTSDHGDAFGEKIHPLIPIRVYFHPRDIRIPALVKVPWLIVEGKGIEGRIEQKRIELKVEKLRKRGKI